MRGAGLRGVSRRKWITTTVRDRAQRPAPDLVDRAFSAPGPNVLWVADITYILTWSGFLYLAVVLDVWSRRIVGWAMETHLRTTLVLAALDMAVAQRQPSDVIHHSDQGCQYTAVAFGHRCRAAGVRPSMGSVGDCYDNALCESFFATLECELLDRSSFRRPAEARRGVFDFIEGWYNTQRRHSALGYDSPLAFEQRHQAATAAPVEGARPVDAKSASTSPLENVLRTFPTPPTGDSPAIHNAMRPKTLTRPPNRGRPTPPVSFVVTADVANLTRPPKAMLPSSPPYKTSQAQSTESIGSLRRGGRPCHVGSRSFCL